ITHLVGQKRVPVAGLQLRFGLGADIDFASVVAAADPVRGKAVVHRASLPAGVDLDALHVKKLSDLDRVRVCPGAATLADVESACAGGYLLVQGHADLNEVATLDGEAFWRITGITGTGALVEAPPVATGDSYAVNEATTLNVAAPGVLGNDTDPVGGALTALLVTNASNGMLSLNADGSFTYTPNPNFSGPDSFTYRANNGLLDSSTATVSITVNPVNDVPVASNLFISPGSPTTADNLIANYTYSDAEGDPELGTEVRWFKGGVVQTSLNDQTTVTASATVSGEQWHFTVRPKDGTDFGTLQTSGTVAIAAVDTAPPALTLPSNITAEATSPTGRLVTFTATAADLV
ncbi:MAG: cadherin-like domain-containing protein, partial [Actinomycetota bacterium]